MLFRSGGARTVTAPWPTLSGTAMSVQASVNSGTSNTGSSLYPYAAVASGTLVTAGSTGNLSPTISSASAYPMAILVALAPDVTAPTVSTFALQAGSDSGRLNNDRLTNAASLVYDLTFSESVTGLAAADFTVSGTATGCVVGTPSGSGTTYTVTDRKSTRLNSSH